MTDHADTIRRELDNLAQKLIGVPWAQAIAEMENDELSETGAAALRFVASLVAERQQAIDERDEVIAALSRADERIAELFAHCEQAIDALRHMRDADPDYVDAALLNLGE